MAWAGVGRDSGFRKKGTGSRRQWMGVGRGKWWSGKKSVKAKKSR
jgi:hypothetical protein